MRNGILAVVLSTVLASPAVLAAPKKGEPLPPFSLRDAQGKLITQKTLEGTDLGVVYFFSTENCAICLKGLEHLRGIAKDHQDDSLRILALGKQDMDTLKRLVSLGQGPIHLMAADADTLGRYNARYVLPTTYVTGPRGEILNVLQGGGSSAEAMLVSLAEKQLQRKKPASAEKMFASAESAGGGSLASAGKAYSLLRAGKLDAAEKLFQSLALAKDKETQTRGLEGLAEVQLARGHTDLALRTAEQVLSKSPNRVAANLIKARALHKGGDDAQTEQSLAVATRDDASADFSFQKSEANLAQGNLLKGSKPKIALASLRTAAKENPHSVEALSNLGALQRSLGDPAKALESLSKAQALAPEDKLVHSLLIQAQEAMAQQQDLQKQRYIDETVKDLVARFQEQQTRKAQAPGDEWTSPPMVVSILGFRSEGPVDLNGRIGMDSALEHELQGALLARGIQVVDRALIDKLLAELKLGSSDLADPETQLKLGRIMAARLIATGSLLQASQTLAALRLIDTETTGIVLSASEQGGLDPQALSNRLADAVLKSVRAGYPLKGRVALVDGEQVILNLGKRHGVSVGQEFNILGKPEPVELNGKVLGYRETKLGQLRVTEVQDGLSYAKATGTGAGLEKNQRIIQKD